MDSLLSEDCFLAFIEFIHDLTGISISSDRLYMVAGRLGRRVAAHGLTSYDDYLHLVKRDKAEQARLIDVVTTNETYCFRTPRIWKYLEETFLPEWYANNPKRRFLAWSAAASTGEEAISLGVLCQAFKDQHSDFKYRILGTDISQKVIQHCQQGRYSGRSIRHFRDHRPDWFARYMHEVDDGVYQASEEIAERTRFHTHNLFLPLPVPDRFSLILLRNVLIYFRTEDQERVLSLMASRAEEGGKLIIGESESLAHINSSYRKMEPYVYEACQESLIANGDA